MVAARPALLLWLVQCGGSAVALPNDAGADVAMVSRDAGSETTGPPMFTGTVEFTQYTGQPLAFTGDYLFYDSLVPSPPCQGGTSMGNCCYTLEPLTRPPSPLTWESAGAITVIDGTSVLDVLSPDVAGYRSSSNIATSAFTWTPGDTLSVSATGATVAGFTGTVVTPMLLMNVAPLSSQFDHPAPVDRSSDFTITWLPAGGTIELVLAADLQGAYAQITCTSGDDGMMTVPSALMSKVPTGSPGKLILTRTQTSTPTDPNAAITLAARVSVSGFVTYE